MSVAPNDPIQQLETQRTFPIRYNACGCIIDTPELDYEVRLGQRWQRVFIQANESELPQFRTFRTQMLRNPRAVILIEAEFTGVFYQWMQGHQAPGLRFSGLVESLPESP